LDGGQRVQVGQEVVALVLGLKADELSYRSKVITDVQRARRLNAGKNAHVSSGGG
jgi:hypothetical protein